MATGCYGHDQPTKMNSMPEMLQNSNNRSRMHRHRHATYGINQVLTAVYMVPAGGWQPPQCCPSQQPPPWGSPSHRRPSIKISYSILTCWPRATNTLLNRIPPCSVHYCLAMPIQSIYNVLLPIEYLYRSHIL